MGFFFNKTRWVALKLSDQVLIKPDLLFSIPLVISDAITLAFPTSVTASLVKTSGRNKTTLSDAVTVTILADGSYAVSSTISSTSWNGTDGLILNLLVDGATVPLQLVVGQ